jgi:hypothetical protein
VPTLDRITATIGDLAQHISSRDHRAHPWAGGVADHGQQEFAIFAWQLDRQIGQLREQEYLGKPTARSGNFSASLLLIRRPTGNRAFAQLRRGAWATWNPLTTRLRVTFSRRDFPHHRTHRDDSDSSRATSGLTFRSAASRKDRPGEVGSW